MNLESVLLLMGAQLALDGNELIRYANEDVLGGYSNIPSLSKWEGGSMWESEGRMIYALVRALKPAVIVELGGYIGCSASHMAAAVMMNGVGKVYSLDNGRAGATHGRAIPENLRHLVQLISADGLEWLEAQDDNSIDFLLEDMMHDTPAVKVIAELAMQKLKPGGLLVNHDAMHDFAWADQNRNKLGSSVGAEVREGLRQAHVEFRGYITDESDCGLSIAQKPRVVEGDTFTVLADIHSVEITDTELPKPEPKKRGRKPKTT